MCHYLDISVRGYGYYVTVFCKLCTFEPYPCYVNFVVTDQPVHIKLREILYIYLCTLLCNSFMATRLNVVWRFLETIMSVILVLKSYSVLEYRDWGNHKSHNLGRILQSTTIVSNFNNNIDATWQNKIVKVPNGNVVMFSIKVTV